MTVFLSGGAKCGKSALAQRMAVALAGGRRLYYVATLRSTGREDDARIRRHLADRAGMGFETVECFRCITDCLPSVDSSGVFLVDSVTSLLQNAMFSPENGYAADVAGARACIASLEAFARAVGSAVFVSDDIAADGLSYPESTETYRRCLAEAGRRLAALCDTVVEVTAGQTIVYKGEMLP